MHTNFQNFHDLLKYYADAVDPEDLAARVLNQPVKNIDILKDTEAAQKVCLILQSFLSNNANHIIRNDLANLNKVENLTQWFNAFTSGIIDDKLSKTLEKTVAASITLAHNNAVEALNPSSIESLEDVFSIVGEYITFEDFEKFKKLGIDTPSEALKETVENMKRGDLEGRDDVKDFWNLISQWRESNPQIFKEVIHTFFKYASSSNQAYFFEFVPDGEYLSDIISLLPEDMTHLAFTNCKCFNDRHIESIVNRLNKLEALEFEGGHISDRSVRIIAGSPNMHNLKKLFFWTNFSLTDEAARLIANSEHLNNLTSLTFSSCTNISDRGIIAIANSENMNKLQELNVAWTAITDEGVRNIANSPFINDIRFLCFAGCKNLTDRAVSAIANARNENNLQANMTNLQTLYFNNCESLTDSALQDLARSDNMKQLEKLSIDECEKLTTSGFKVLTESALLPKLTSIGYIRCPLIDKNEANRLIQQMRLRKTAAP